MNYKATLQAMTNLKSAGASIAKTKGALKDSVNAMTSNEETTSKVNNVLIEPPRLKKAFDDSRSFLKKFMPLSSPNKSKFMNSRNSLKNDYQTLSDIL